MPVFDLPILEADFTGVFSYIGGDYEGVGMHPPKILLGGCKHPPQQLLLLVKKIRLFPF